MQVALVLGAFSPIGKSVCVKAIELEDGDPDPGFLDNTYADFKYGLHDNTEAHWLDVTSNDKLYREGDVRLEIKSGLDSGNWENEDNYIGAFYFGESCTGAGDNIYVIRGHRLTGTQFYCYDPSRSVGDRWLILDNNIPWPVDAIVDGEPVYENYDVKNGTAMVWDNEDHIYLFAGAEYEERRFAFFRYSISNDNWEALENTPHSQGAGDALAWVNFEHLGGENEYIYAAIGTTSSAAYPSAQLGMLLARFNITEWNADPDDTPSKWENLYWQDGYMDEGETGSIPYGCDDGSSLAWTGENYLYYLVGAYNEVIGPENENHFLRYGIIGENENQWDELAPTPYNATGGVDDGGSLVWLGGHKYLYALKGGDDDDGGGVPGDNFWRYNIVENEWEDMPNVPDGTGDYNGCRLGVAGGKIYYWRGRWSTGFWLFEPRYQDEGRFISQKFTTGYIENWQEIGWRTTLGDNRYVVVDEPSPLVDGNPRAGVVTGGSITDTRTIDGAYENIREAISEPTPHLNWEHRIGGVATGYGRYILRIRGYTSGPDGDNVSVYIWDNDANDWEFVDNLTPTEETITKVIPGPDITRYLRDDNFSVRYATENDELAAVDDETTAHIDLCALEAVSISIFARASADNISWTDWEGPYSNPLGSPIIELGDNQYIQYRAEFETGDNLITPVLEWVKIIYTHLP